MRTKENKDGTTYTEPVYTESYNKYKGDYLVLKNRWTIMVRKNKILLMNKYQMRSFFYINLMFILSFCDGVKKQESKRMEIGDPYIKSFWGKNIKYMIKESLYGYIDTIAFDRSGNMIEIQSLGKVYIKQEFNNNHLVTRHWIGDDLFEHNLITYDTNFNVLIQNWVRINTSKWDYSPEDINGLKKNYSIFFFNEENRVQKEINLKEEFIITYKYDKGVLIESNKCDYKTNNKIETLRYFYEHNDMINRIEEYYYGDHISVPDLIRYFSGGRLDSTQHLSPKSTIVSTEKYRYIYTNDY